MDDDKDLDDSVYHSNYSIGFQEAENNHSCSLSIHMAIEKSIGLKACASFH